MTIGEKSGAEIAIVFGAGASAPPLKGQRALVEGLLAARSQPRIRKAQRYLRHAFPGLGTGDGTDGRIRFEDIVGPLEIAESEEYWFHFGGRERDMRLVSNREVLDSLDTWVAMCLDPQDIPKPPSMAEHDKAAKGAAYLAFYSPSDTAPLPYARLVNFLDKSGLLPRTAFLSMNYDVLFDRVLRSSTARVPKYCIDAFYREPPEPPTAAQVLLLKLHGSLNWRVCDACHVLADLGEFVAWPGDRCPECRAMAARPMLIRPTLLKDFRHRVWKDLWRAAGHLLAEARTWVFVGYSLPMADVWMLRLL
ncbi:MAG TPA: hypothetical protein VNJ12_13925, partial [Candidatus Dormibacteraeota bacterium]|nr:hypothetical protein [Candidatus Dormibacteraeota bacterium]